MMNNISDASRQEYQVTGKAYLERANQLLSTEAASNLFYAAYELRCGIEARIKEYLDARAELLSKKKHGYQIAKLAKGLDQVFAAGKQVIEMQAFDAAGIRQWQVLFTPVRPILRQYAGKLGDLLHSQPFRSSDEEWWREQRLFLLAVSDELRFATTGALLGPPLIEIGTRHMSVVVSGTKNDELGSKLTRIGESLTVRVRYLDSIPET